MRIDLNADLGEGMGDDRALLSIVTSANVATGAHAGGGELLRETVAAAVAAGVSVGAHPSYRDRTGFGRRSMLATLRAEPSGVRRLVADLAAQVLLVCAETERWGVPLAHVKAHGALYNDAVRDERAADLLVEAVEEASRQCGYDLAVLTQPTGALAGRGRAAGLRVLDEGFVDRAYDSSGALVGRDRAGAVHVEVSTMVAQALGLAHGRVHAVDGSSLDLSVDSLCVHGDTLGAVRAAREVRAALEADGWMLRPPELPSAGHPPLSARLRAAGPADSVPAVSIDPFGDQAVLVRPGDGTHAGTDWILRMSRAAARTLPDAIVLPGLDSVLVETGPEPGARDSIRRLEAALLATAISSAEAPAAVGPSADRQHLIGVRYDGPDLAEVAEAAGVSVAELVSRHSATTWRVAAVGFSPGFGYLTSPDPLFDGLPRRVDPRRRVPAGSVALAAGMCAVYPSASPGGWQLIGSSSVPLFSAEQTPPALLAAGDTVRFEAIG